MDNIVFENNSFEYLNKYLNDKNYSSIFVIVDENTEKNCLYKISNHIPKKIKYHIIKVKAGEKNKSIESVIRVWKELLSLNADKNSILINLGGGLVTDLGGFIASTFKRGIDYINIPTTVLSMVDASLGGKTGINFDKFKNQIGTFYNPNLILINTDFLNTLPVREKKSGLAEMIKHALILDRKQWEKMKNISDHNKIINTDTIKRSIEIKNEIVAMDPREEGLRKILNFGHTIGHAVESFFIDKSKPVLHGEAIALGMICESYISNIINDLSYNDMMDIKGFINNIFDKIMIERKYYDDIINIMKHDKKNINYKKINFSTLSNIGKCEFDYNVDDDLIKKSLDFYTLKD